MACSGDVVRHTVSASHVGNRSCVRAGQDSNPSAGDWDFTARRPDPMGNVAPEISIDSYAPSKYRRCNPIVSLHPIRMTTNPAAGPGGDIPIPGNTRPSNTVICFDIHDWLRTRNITSSARRGSDRLRVRLCRNVIAPVVRFRTHRHLPPKQICLSKSGCAHCP